MIDLQGTEYVYLQVPISRHYSLPVKNKQASSWEEDGAPAAACSLASVPKRRSLAAQGPRLAWGKSHAGSTLSTHQVNKF